jgi:hypothetical protein
MTCLNHSDFSKIQAMPMLGDDETARELGADELGQFFGEATGGLSGTTNEDPVKGIQVQVLVLDAETVFSSAATGLNEPGGLYRL